jgi:hypothetical protein
MLRDPRVKKTVLEVRKRHAFIGYTWRSSRHILRELEKQNEYNKHFGDGEMKPAVGTDEQWGGRK